MESGANPGQTGYCYAEQTSNTT